MSAPVTDPITIGGAVDCVRSSLSAAGIAVPRLEARLLVGAGRCAPGGTVTCHVVDEGHERDLDLELEVPDDDLEASIAAARRRTVSGAWAFDRRASTAGPIIAASLARWTARNPSLRSPQIL